MIRIGLAGLILLIVLIDAAPVPGATPIQHVTGNGRITVALDGEGCLTQFYWPGPGAGQHFGESGAHWSLGTLESPGAFTADRWLIAQDYLAPDSLILVTRYIERGGSRSAEQTVAAVPGTDLVVVRLRLRGFAPDTPCFWVQTVEPFELPLPGFAVSQPGVRALNRFASGFDVKAGLLEHFRPSHAGQAYEKAARAWADHGANADFGPGVYVGAVSPNEIAQAALYPVSSPGEEWKPGTPFPGIRRALGRATGIMELVPEVSDEALELVVLLGASPARAGLHAVLSEGLKRGVDPLESDASDLGTLWGALPPPAAGSDPTALRAQLNLLLCLDRESGAAVHAPALSGSATYCDVADTAWASAALDTLGDHDRAARALAVHVDAVRAERGTDTPAGSLPRMIHPDGTAASVWGNADPESAAWILAACWRHAASLPVAKRAAWLEPIWSVLSLAADYLAREPQVGATLSGALPPEAAPLETLRTHYLGLESSRRMAESLGKAEPTLWWDRRGELYSRIRFRKLNQTGAGDAGGPWVDWWIDSLPGAKSESGWEVLRTGGGNVLSEVTIQGLVVEAGLGDAAPLARRDALRCLMATGSH